jgi:hypothetical protein
MEPSTQSMMVLKLILVDMLMKRRMKSNGVLAKVIVKQISTIMKLREFGLMPSKGRLK